MKILKRILLIFLAFIGMVVLAGIAMAVYGVALPRPTGPESTGRVIFRWRDNTRPEVMTDNPNDRREVVVEIWYPAIIEGIPHPASYFPDLDRLQTALKESGEIEDYERLGLSLVKTHNYENPAL